MTTDILELVGEHSITAVFIAAVVGGAVFILQKATERAISNEFDRRATAYNLGLERRSRFEEMILIERYETISDILSRCSTIVADLNRRRHGTEVEGLMRGNDIVPLTEVFAILAAKKHVLTDRFHPQLFEIAGVLITLARHYDDIGAKPVLDQYVSLVLAVQNEMNLAFGLNAIEWHAQAQ